MNLLTILFGVSFVIFYWLYPMGLPPESGPFVNLLQNYPVEFQPFLFWEQGSYYVLLTAQLCHDGLGHLVNNVVFSLPLLESLSLTLSWVSLASLSFICGAAGLLLTWLMNRLAHGELAQFSSTVGYSPAMYGLAFFVLARAEPTDAVGSLVPGLHPGFLVLVYSFFPYLEYVYHSCKLPKPRAHRHYFLALFVSLLALGIIWETQSISSEAPALSAYIWILIYLLKGLLFDLYWHWLGVLNTADHACHVGGALMGTLLGLLTIQGDPWLFLCVGWILLSSRWIFSKIIEKHNS